MKALLIAFEGFISQAKTLSILKTPSSKIVDKLYQDQDPRQVFYNKKPYHFIQQEQGHLLSVHLPFLKEKEVSVTQRGDELIINAKNRRRTLFLPQFLAYYRVAHTQMMDGRLLIRFEKIKTN